MALSPAALALEASTSLHSSKSIFYSVLFYSILVCINKQQGENVKTLIRTVGPKVNTLISTTVSLSLYSGTAVVSGLLAA